MTGEGPRVQTITAVSLAVALEGFLLLVLFTNPPDPPLDFYDVFIGLSQVPGIGLLFLGQNAVMYVGMFAIQVFVFYYLALNLLRRTEGYRY